MFGNKENQQNRSKNEQGSKIRLPNSGEELYKTLGSSSVVTAEECTWLLKNRSGFVLSYLKGECEARVLLDCIDQDYESRYISGYDGLYSSQE